MSLSPHYDVPDCDYLLQRAADEADCARSAETDQAHARAEAHRQLANGYLDRLFGAQPIEQTTAEPAASRARMIAPLLQASFPCDDDGGAGLDCLVKALAAIA